MILKFGKHAGTDIQDVPLDYLEWMLAKCKQDVVLYQGEIERRELVESASLSTVEKIVQAGYRTLAKTAHPDSGGTTADFQALQAGMEQLKMILREVANVTGTGTK